MNRTMSEKGKFMMCLEPRILRLLERRAKPLGINIQELIRVKVIPEFLYGPVQLNPQLIRKLLKDGYFKNGHSRKLSR